MKRLFLAVVLSACGGAPAPVETADVERREETPREAPYPREASLPAAPEAVVEVDIEVVRGTPLYDLLRDEMDGDDPEEMLGRSLLERTRTVRMARYSGQRAFVLIAVGPLEGAVDEVVAQLSDGRDPPPRVERSGFRAYVFGDTMLAAQTAPDTVVLSYPQYADEILRTASGEAPATPLPEEMRTLLERPAMHGATLRMVFRGNDEDAADPLGALVRDAGFAGVAARFDGGEIVATGMARASSVESAAQLAAGIERFSRETTDDRLPSPTLAQGIRNAEVRADDRWVEVTLRFPPQDFEPFMRIVGQLGGI